MKNFDDFSYYINRQNLCSGFMKLIKYGNIIPSKLYLSHRISGQ
nr:MAG TPA: hypothetical protein [Bacteriophage sp.]